MNISQAVEALQRGCKVKRDSSTIVHIMDRGTIYFVNGTNRFRKTLFLVEDVLGDDWRIVN